MKFAVIATSAALLLLSGCQVSSDNESSTAIQPSTEQTAPAVDTAHTSQNALDWEGSYVGTFPCADCSGIKTTINLHKDGSYAMKETYLGKENATFRSQGTFSWNEAGNVISLSGIVGSPNKFFVGENKLFKLDGDGNKVSGPLAEHYVLTKN